MSGDPFWDEPAELDDARGDALLEGRTSAGDIPSGYEDVAQLVAVIRSGLEPDAAIKEPPTVTALLELFNRGHVREAPRSPRRGRKRAAAAGAVIGMLVSAGTAAAAAGRLPAAIQEVAHHVAAELGISIPDPAASSAKSNPDGGQNCEHSSERTATTAGSSFVLSCEGLNGLANAWEGPLPLNELRANKRLASRAGQPTTIVNTGVPASRASISRSTSAQHPEGPVTLRGKSSSPPNNQGRGPTGGQPEKTGGAATPRRGAPKIGATASPRRSYRREHSRSQVQPPQTDRGQSPSHDTRRRASRVGIKSRSVPPASGVLRPRAHRPNPIQTSGEAMAGPSRLIIDRDFGGVHKSKTSSGPRCYSRDHNYSSGHVFRRLNTLDRDNRKASRPQAF
jgi:hypothetical protein